MVRTQLYLPEKSYKYVKKAAVKKKMSFASYVRVLIEKDEIDKKKNKTLEERFPFIGMIKGVKGPAGNEEIDEALMDIYENKR